MASLAGIPYSAARRAGDFLFISGQIGLDADGHIVEGLAAQVRQSLENLKGVLADNGLGVENVIKTTVFLTDMAGFPMMNEIYAETFVEPFPGRSTVAVAALPKAAEFEIEAIAYAG